MTDSDAARELLLDNFPAGIVFLYEGRRPPRYTFVAGKGIENIGLTKADLEGNPVAAERPEDIRDRVRSRYRDALDGEEVTFEVEVEGRDFRIRLFPVPDTDHDRGIGIAEDVTEQKAYERKLERQNERLEQLTATLTHDLRNPLNVIGGRLELLEEDCDSEHLDAIANAHGRMKRLIEEMTSLDHAKDHDRLPAVSLETVATDAWRNVATKDATMTVADDLRLTADADELRRLFENLYRNAVEHGRSDVTVTVGTLGDGFYVADDGPGIPAGEREDVFERGYSTADGTGLGLFIVETIAESHGWDVAAEESDDGGARFEFTDVTFA